MNLKTFGLAAVLAATSLMAFASASLADEFTSPEKQNYTEKIIATSTNMKLNGAFTSVECGHSKIEGNITKHGGAYQDTGGEIKSLSFASCNYTVTAANNGTYDVDRDSGINGNFELFNTQISAETSVGTCIWTASSGGTNLGAFTGNNNSNAEVEFGPGEIPRTGGSFLCGSKGYWLGTYTVTTPKTLAVDGI